MLSVNQRKLRRLHCESLEDRRCMTAESVGWDGPGQGSATLTYHINNVPSYLNEATVDRALTTAMNAWSEVIDVNFLKTDKANQADSIDISFAPIDGSGGTLAQAYLPDDVNSSRIAGDIQFDSSELWEVGNSQGSRAFDLVMVAVHELGHSLGLDHSNGANSVMAASVSALASFSRLTEADLDAALALYAPATSSSATPSGTLLPPLTTALAGGSNAELGGGTTSTTPTSTTPPSWTNPSRTPPSISPNATPRNPNSLTPGGYTRPGWEITTWISGPWGRWLGSEWSLFSGTVPSSSSAWLTNLSTHLHSSWRIWWV